MKITRGEFLKIIAVLPAVLKNQAVNNENHETRKMIFGLCRRALSGTGFH